MTTRTATKVATGVTPKSLRVGLVTVTSTYSIPAGASLSAGDVIQMVKVPANATPIYVAVSGGNGALVIKVGDGISTGRYLATKSASAGMALSPINTAYVPYTYSLDDTIDILISAASVTTVGGAFNLVAVFAMDT